MGVQQSFDGSTVSSPDTVGQIQVQHPHHLTSCAPPLLKLLVPT
jgi:hypothetical protein